MVIAIIDKKGEPDACAAIVRELLPDAACLIATSAGEIWRADGPVPPLSGVLVHGDPDELAIDEKQTLDDLALRFPVVSTVSAATPLAEWASRCGAFPPQFPRQPERYPWDFSLLVQLPRSRAPRMCSAGNVSLGGLYVQDPRTKPEVGVELSLRFPLLGNRVSAAAVVVWVQPRRAGPRSPGYGCQFVGTDLWIRGILVNAARQPQQPRSNAPGTLAPPSRRVSDPPSTERRASFEG